MFNEEEDFKNLPHQEGRTSKEMYIRSHINFDIFTYLYFTYCLYILEMLYICEFNVMTFYNQLFGENMDLFVCEKTAREEEDVRNSMQQE